MKTLQGLVLASSLAFATLAAQAETFTADLGGGNGTVIDVTNPGGFFDVAFVMLGSDTGEAGNFITTYTATSSGEQSVSGDFSYFTTDVDGPGLDLFGYVLNDVFFQLSDNEGEATQIGSFSFNVSAGDVFGWYVQATDNQLGLAVVTVGANLEPIPLPATLPLLGSALAGIVALRRRRS